MTWLLLSVPVCIVARVARDTLRYRREVTGPPTVRPRWIDVSEERDR